MKLFNKLSPKGFTLIELLIVIAVLGILAAGVLVAINPVKKVNQANDARLKNDIGQIAQAAQAYYTTKQAYVMSVADLVTASELKSEPKHPVTGLSYSVAGANSAGTACTTAANDCANVIIYTLMSESATTYYCWASSTGAVKISAAGATAPVATAIACP